MKRSRRYRHHDQARRPRIQRPAWSRMCPSTRLRDPQRSCGCAAFDAFQPRSRSRSALVSGFVTVQGRRRIIKGWVQNPAS